MRNRTERPVGVARDTDAAAYLEPWSPELERRMLAKLRKLARLDDDQAASAIAAMRVANPMCLWAARLRHADEDVAAGERINRLYLDPMPAASP